MTKHKIIPMQLSTDVWASLHSWIIKETGPDRKTQKVEELWILQKVEELWILQDDVCYGLKYPLRTQLAKKYG